MASAKSSRSGRRPFWADLRFALGIVLVIVSVAGVAFVVSAASRTDSVYAARSTLVPGQEITARDVAPVDVALGTLAAEYLSEGELRAGMVATRVVAEGELIAVGALGKEEETTVTNVVLRSDVDVPRAVAPGDTVEIWMAEVLDTGAVDMPRVLVSEATVVSVSRDDSMIGGGAAQVEVVIPRSDVAAVLQGLSNGSGLSVVPMMGATP